MYSIINGRTFRFYLYTFSTRIVIGWHLSHNVCLCKFMPNLFCKSFRFFLLDKKWNIRRDTSLYSTKPINYHKFSIIRLMYLMQYYNATFHTYISVSSLQKYLSVWNFKTKAWYKVPNILPKTVNSKI